MWVLGTKSGQEDDERVPKHIDRTKGDHKEAVTQILEENKKKIHFIRKSDLSIEKGPCHEGNRKGRYS